MTAPDSTAPSADTYTPVVTDLMRLVRVLFSPGAVFEEQKDKPTFWMPYLLMAIGFAAITVLSMPYQMRAREIMMANAGRTMPAGTGGGIATIVGAIVAPIMILVILAIMAGILYVLVQVMSGETTYKKMMTVVVFTMPLGLLQQVVNLVVLRMRGMENIRSLADMQVSLGLDLLLPVDAQVGGFMRGMLAGIGPLQIWSLAITAVGLMVLGRLEKGKAWTAATVSFVIMLLFAGVQGMMAARALVE